MQQLVYVAAGRLEIHEATAPALRGGDDALVRPVVVSTCDLDGAMIAGRTPFAGPFPLGHEGVAEVVDVGDRVRAVSPGQLVSVPFQISCGTCASCGRGHTAHCTGHGAGGQWRDAAQMYGIGPTGAQWGGFLSDLVRVPFADHMLVGLADDVDPLAVASLSDNIVDGYRTVAEPLAQWPAAPVLIVGGSGSIALYAAGAALALGAERVDYLDRDAARLQRAERIGAHAIEIEKKYPERTQRTYPVTVDASATPGGLRLALRSTAREGVCTSTGIYWQQVELPLLEMYLSGITFRTGLTHARPAMPAVLELVRAGRMHPELVTARTVQWDDAIPALTETRDKLVITRHD